MQPQITIPGFVGHLQRIVTHHIWLHATRCDLKKSSIPGSGAEDVQKENFVENH